MDTNRREKVGTHTIEEYGRNGVISVFVDNHRVSETFEDAISRLENEVFDEAFENHAEERNDQRERQWLHDMGQGA